MLMRCAVFLFAMLCAGFARAGDGEIVFIAATNHTMPLSAFHDRVLSAGILKDLGDAIGERLGRRVRYLSLPPKRVPIYLANGDADGLCYISPRWVDGDFHWSRPLIPATGVLAARGDAPVARHLEQLADVPIGTVAAYRYRNFDEALGRRFARDDAPSQENNVAKLLAGRLQYAILEKITYDYLVRGNPHPDLRADQEFQPLKAQCAFSKKSPIPFADIERAINGLVADGSVERILARYR